jgi:DoxX-like family
MMQSLFKPAPAPQAAQISREGQPSQIRRWAGGIMAAIAVVFLVFDGIIKVKTLGPVAVLGAIELASLLLYAIPRTSVLGAIMMTGFLGGAVATHVRAGSPLWTATLLPVYIALLTWGGLFLREGRLRPLVPLRR